MRVKDPNPIRPAAQTSQPTPVAKPNLQVRKAFGDEMSTGKGGALRRAASSLLGAALPVAPAPATNLRTEVLGDGNANCLERALALTKPGDQVMLLRDTRDGVGHAVIVRPDGTVIDPNDPRKTSPNLERWLAAHPRYEAGRAVDAGVLSTVLKVPPGPRRDAVLSALGLGSVARQQVADSGEARFPAWVSTPGARPDDIAPSTWNHLAPEDRMEVWNGARHAVLEEAVLSAHPELTTIPADRPPTISAAVWERLPRSEKAELKKEWLTERRAVIEEQIALLGGDAITEGGMRLEHPIDGLFTSSYGNGVSGQFDTYADTTNRFNHPAAQYLDLPLMLGRQVPVGVNVRNLDGSVQEPARDSTQNITVLATLTGEQDDALDAAPGAGDQTWLHVRFEDGTTGYVAESRTTQLYAKPHTNLCGPLATAHALGMEPAVALQLLSTLDSSVLEHNASMVSDPLRAMFEAQGFTTTWGSAGDPPMEDLRAQLAAGNQIIALVSMTLGSGGMLREGGDVPHFVDVEAVEQRADGEWIVRIYNPYMNSEEVYTWAEFSASWQDTTGSSFANRMLVATPPAGA
jgi:hypothetical protein